MLRKETVHDKLCFLPLSNYTHKPKPVIIKDTKSANNYETIKEKVTLDKANLRM